MLCTIGPEGLALWAAAAIIDPIPGGATFLGIAAAGAGASCGVREAFVDEFGRPDRISVYRAEEYDGELKQAMKSSRRIAEVHGSRL